MNARLQLSRPARRRIQKLDRRMPHADMRVRCRVVLKVAAGLSCKAAAREVGCAPSTAVRIVARFRAEGEAALFDLILYNYVIHKSAVTKAWLAQFGAHIQLHFLPPYCPNENRIERLWLDLHANVTRNHPKRTMRALLESLHRCLTARFDTE